jgi:hypothetical protein
VLVGSTELNEGLGHGLKQRSDAQGLLPRLLHGAVHQLSTGVARKTGLHVGRLFFAGAHRVLGGHLHTLVNEGSLSPEAQAILRGFGIQVCVGRGVGEGAVSPLVERRPVQGSDRGTRDGSRAREIQGK